MLWMPIVFFFEVLAFLKVIKQKGVNPWKLLFSAYVFRGVFSTLNTGLWNLHRGYKNCILSNN